MNHFGHSLNIQQNNLVSNLYRLGITPDQIIQMMNHPAAVSPVSHSAQNGSYVPDVAVKQESESIALKTQDAAYEEGLLLKMFSTFCGEQPQSAKELSIAFTKFARWVQSTVDKAG